jgi:hypothetical protein
MCDTRTPERKDRTVSIAKTLMLTAAVAAGVLAAAFAGSGALESAGAPPPVLAPMPAGFGRLDRLAAVMTPLPAMPVAPQP